MTESTRTTSYTPSDYSPTYWIEVDSDGRFIGLVRVRTLPPEFDIESDPDLPITPEVVARAKERWQGGGSWAAMYGPTSEG